MRKPDNPSAYQRQNPAGLKTATRFFDPPFLPARPRQATHRGERLLCWAQMRLSPAVAGATILAKLLYRYFIRGLLTALPLGLTVYFLYVFLRWSESVAIRLIRPFIGD
ncbi:MAG: hypothetical protein AB1716_21600, partial [Planctomycetota bacterium]